MKRTITSNQALLDSTKSAAALEASSFSKPHLPFIVNSRVQKPPALLACAHQRTISDLAIISHELFSKNLLILGRVELPFNWLVIDMNMNVRRVSLTEYLTVDFTVETYFAEGYRTYSTSFSKEAFQGSWDFVVTNQSPTSTTVGPIVLNILQRSMTQISAKELLLIPTIPF